MSSIATAAERIRDRLVMGSASYREVARRAGLSNSTVREFARTGSARVETVARIEDAVKALDPQPAECGPAASCDVQ